jgi:hypothetical protein
MVIQVDEFGGFLMDWKAASSTAAGAPIMVMTVRLWSRSEWRSRYLHALDGVDRSDDGATTSGRRASEIIGNTFNQWVWHEVLVK